jgi:hypothetical protein
MRSTCSVSTKRTANWCALSDSDENQRVRATKPDRARAGEDRVRVIDNQRPGLLGFSWSGKLARRRATSCRKELQTSWSVFIVCGYFTYSVGARRFEQALLVVEATEKLCQTAQRTYVLARDRSSQNRKSVGLALALAASPTRLKPTQRMLVEASIWKAFHEAKSALLKELTPSIRHPHILSATPQSRESIRTSTIELISAIIEAQHDLKAVQNELEAAQTLLSQRHAAAKNSLSPIGALPPELIHMIVLYASDVSDPLQVLHMSHVSKTWRETVISDPTLFTCADWDHWNHSLVTLWCTRAGSQPLTIRLGHNAICETAKYGKRKLRGRLISCLPQLGRLHIHDANISSLVYAMVQGTIDFCLIKPAPLLTHLSIHADAPFDYPYTSHSFNINQDTIPALCALNLGDNLGPVHLGPRSKLKAFAFSMLSVDMWSKWRVMLRGFPNLEDLRIGAPSGLDMMSPSGHDSPATVLPSLKHLELSDLEISSETGLIRLLEHLVTPGLRAVTVSYPLPESCQFIYGGLVSILLKSSGSV